MKRLLAILLVLFASAAPAQAASPNGPVLYIAVPGTLYAYQVGTWQQLSKTSIPTSTSIRGVAMDPSRSSLYITYGGHGGSSGNGSMLRYNLATAKTVWNIHYPHGVDMPAVCGGVVYVAAGSGSTGTTWYEMSADTGAQLSKTLSGGTGPHNTICHNGHVYMGGEKQTPGYLYETGLGASRVGPAPTPGVRPFTVNGSDTRVYWTSSNYRGYTIGSTATGKVVKTVSFGSVPGGSNDAWSHGISMNPAGTELYVLDLAAQRVRVYSTADTAQHLADVALQHKITGSESPCSNACTREGWLLHSLDGRYVFVSDSGDVINTATRSVVAYLAPLANSKHGDIEVDWSGGQPVATSTHFGVGH